MRYILGPKNGNGMRYIFGPKNRAGGAEKENIFDDARYFVCVSSVCCARVCVIDYGPLAIDIGHVCLRLVKQ